MTPKILSLSLILSILIVFPAAATVNLAFSFGSLRPPVVPGAHMTFFGAAFRGPMDSGSDATDATLTIPLAAGTSNITAVGNLWNCSVQSTTIVCTTSIPATLNSTALQVDFDVPSSPDGGDLTTTATLTTSVPNTSLSPNAQLYIVVYRTLTVTTADDFGAGSLRDTIARANDLCDGRVPCRMLFSGAMTIEPRSQLPAITACSLIIDGGVDPSVSQDVERPVEISGTKAGFANGLELRSSCGVTLRGLTINGFGANGIVLAAPKPLSNAGPGNLNVQGCFVGTDTKAEEARPNGMRGIALETPFTIASVGNCTISGNHYSGIAVWAADLFSVYACRIGVGRDLQPLGNGASGVYVDGGHATVESSVIANNHDFGVAVGPHASDVVADVQGIFANRAFDYDWGLDGPTHTDPAGRMPPSPALIDASYDPARNSTVVRAVLPAEGRRPGYFSIRLFEVTPNGYVALVPQVNLIPLSGDAGDFPFTMTVNSDLRGQKIVGQTYFYLSADGFALDSSELSDFVFVH